jgi:hypothetical protein
LKYIVDESLNLFILNLTKLWGNFKICSLLIWCLSSTPFVPNYLILLTRTRILRNLWGIYKNAQLGLDPVLTKLSNELFYSQNGATSQKIWWFDQFYDDMIFSWPIFTFSASWCFIIFAMVYWNQLKFGI